MIVVFAEIQRLGLGWDPLAGVILELSAFLGLHNNTALDAKKLILAHLGGIGTVGAGMGNFLSEQHSSCPLIIC